MKFKYHQCFRTSNEWIFITEGKRYSENAINEYRKNFNIAQYTGDTPKHAYKYLDDSLIDKIVGIIVRLSIHIKKEFIDIFPNLKFIGSPTTGITHFDEAILSQERLQVLTLRDCMEKIKNITATSEHTLGLILALARNIPSYSKSVIENSKWERELFMGNQLSSKTIGIIGFGRIGKQLACACNALSMKVIVYDIKKKLELREYPYVQTTSLEDLLMKSDVISIHASYSYGDPPILSKNELQLMKPEALLVNTARGELIDMSALAEMIRTHRLKGVGLDVLENEDVWKNIIRTHPLAKLARSGYNILITPHIAGCTIESMQETELVLAKLIIRSLFYNTNEQSS